MEKTIKEMLIDKIDEIIANEDEEFYGTKKNPDKELLFKDIAECANALLRMNKFKAYKVCNENDSPAAMVQATIGLPTVFAEYDYSADLLSDMFLKADSVVYAETTDEDLGDVMISFIVKDYWIE